MWWHCRPFCYDVVGLVEASDEWGNVGDAEVCDIYLIGRTGAGIMETVVVIRMWAAVMTQRKSDNRDSTA